MIWRGYNGSQMEYEQLPGGRIIVPYGSFQPHAKTCQFSRTRVSSGSTPAE